MHPGNSIREDNHKLQKLVWASGNMYTGVPILIVSFPSLHGIQVIELISITVNQVYMAECNHRILVISQVQCAYSNLTWGTIWS
jgi:hypothetical protein